MKTSDRGLRLLMEREGFKNVAYPDPGTGAEPWTIGVGHTGPEVHPGLRWSDEQVLAQLRLDVVVAEEIVNRLVKVKLTQDQFDALVSFVFNLGETQFAGSTLLRLLNRGDYDSVPAQMDRWHSPPAIITRRNGEREQFKGTQFVARLDH